MAMRGRGASGTVGRILIIALAGLVLAGCGQSVGGTYVHAGSGMAAYQKLEFGSDDTVDLTSGMGPTMQGTYKVDGKKVVVTVAAGASFVFMVDDDGCLDGGGLMGKYCKQ
jgi:hypothetical protein